MSKLELAVAVLFALSGCSDSTETQDTSAVPDKPGQSADVARTRRDVAPYKVDLPLSEFMPHVMQHAGDGVWKWSGWVVDESGEHSLFPKNGEEWEDAESGALSLAEMTNVLLIPGRRVDDPRWDRSVLQVREVALRAAKAAEEHDKDRFFQVSGELDEACDSCHEVFDPSVASPPKS